MKTLLTLTFVLLIGATGQAKETTPVAKVDTIEASIVTLDLKEEAAPEKTEKVARLYKRSNTKVKKALSFTTKRNRSKLA
ncbi:MAG: hypothetical protein AAFX53_13750 [Bacteroidota bacterium]